MKICVVGLWHLGTVTAACLASAGHDVIGLDFDSEVVKELTAARAPVFEPGLEVLLTAGSGSGRLRFTTDIAEALSQADVIWLAFDTPVDEDDHADVEYVVDRSCRLIPYLRHDTLVLISSQLPAGTTRRLEEAFGRSEAGRTAVFAYSPENLRLGRAIEAFMGPDRVVVGVRSEACRKTVEEVFRPITERIEWMTIESAEMTKHALNAFLATSIAFTNEVAAICEQVGADASEVERGLRSEVRIGPNAYVSPGGAFAGGTLARDVEFLTRLGQLNGVPTHLLSSVKSSNNTHRRWAQRRLKEMLGRIADSTVAVWGLTYKPGTDTLRRSPSIELCRWLACEGAVVRAHDPVVVSLPTDLSNRIVFVRDPLAAVEGCSALVVATQWPEYRQLPAEDVVTRMAGRLVLDANRFLVETLGKRAGIEYLSVGKAGRQSNHSTVG